MGIKETVLRLLFPPRCALCGKPAPPDGEGLCASCAAEPAETLEKYLAVYAAGKGYTVPCFAPQRYREPFRGAIVRFKFQGERGLAPTLARLMLPVVPAGPFDCIVPIPVSDARKRQRGYDQSALLAEALALRLGIPCRPLLEKIRDNPPQHRLTGEARIRNVRGVYRASDAAGLRILLVDDILTTGATAKAACAALFRAGAARIHVVVTAFAGD